MNGTDGSPLEPEWPGGPQSLDDPGQTLDRWRSRVLGWGFSIAVHLVVFIALLWPQPALPPPPPASAPIQVRLMRTPLPPGAPGASASKDDSLPDVVLPELPHPVMPVVTVSAAPDTSDQLSESDLAGAARAGDGNGGGCDTIRRLQTALRRDPLVRAAVDNAGRTGRATMLWNGDWVQSGGQDGKGLSAVREAIMWEVAFAPEACRNERMHGLVLLSLADGTRFAIGSDDWRWSDMLFAGGSKASR